MGFHTDKAHKAGFIQPMENSGQLSISGAGQHHLSVCLFGVFNMDIPNMRPQQFIRFQGILSALNEIGKIKRATEMVSAQRLHQFQAPGRGITVNPLFVFVQQNHVFPAGIFLHLVQSVQYFTPIMGRVLPLGHIKAEHANVPAGKLLGRIHNPAEHFKMGGEIIVNTDFTNGRTDRRHTDARLF